MQTSANGFVDLNAMMHYLKIRILLTVHNNYRIIKLINYCYLSFQKSHNVWDSVSICSKVHQPSTCEIV
jgi:hypothetical protein